jgi:hypothetical protein
MGEGGNLSRNQNREEKDENAIGQRKGEREVESLVSVSLPQPSASVGIMQIQRKMISAEPGIAPHSAGPSVHKSIIGPKSQVTQCTRNEDVLYTRRNQWTCISDWPEWKKSAHCPLPSRPRPDDAR